VRASDVVAVNTRWYSCAIPMATTWERPVAAALRISGIT
jgi:hypothetical protein